MPEKIKPDADKQKREEAVQALRTFEHILEIMPDDHGTLEGAILAAEQCGDLDKAMAYRMKLADLLVAHGDEAGSAVHADVLRSSQDPRARAWLAVHDLRTRNAKPEKKTVSPDENVEWSKLPREEFAFAPANISDEIDLAWRIHEHGDLTQDEYASLVKDLTEMSGSKHRETVSALHALESRHHKNLENILAYISQASRAPYISLACFAMRAELLPLLPEDFIISRGAIPFETMGKEILVAVMNPFSPSLKAEIEKKTAHTCHLFLARASEFEEARTRLRESAQ